MKLTRADRRWIKVYRRQLSEQFPDMVAEVLIYGSKARGEAGPDSDLDVLLIVHDDAAESKREMRKIGYLLDPHGEVIPSIMAYTRTEWKELKKTGSPFRRAVERDGVDVSVPDYRG
jgi:predicted nucleotidyltransferase